jgi:DNA helicase HerA-like ATPase
MTSNAYSMDGKTFAFEATVGSAPAIGSYVTLSVDNGRLYLGQLIEVSVGASNPKTGRLITGHGTLMARLDADQPADLDGSDAFGDGELAPADSSVVATHLSASSGSSARVELGSLQNMATVPASLHAKGFDRHTFLCGQSGSGKTYTLGVVLERLLLDTAITMAVIDPNSDFVNLGTLRPQPETGLSVEDYRDLSERYDKVASGIHVFGGEGAPKRLRALYGRLSLEQQTMILGIDPFTNAEEYNAFLRTVRTLEGTEYSLDDVMAAVRSSFDDDVRRLGLRIDNLGIADQTIWAGADETVKDLLPNDWRMLVADTGSLPSAHEGSIAAAGLLGFLWDQRHARQPLLIVIDEAHNICPQNPVDSNQALATEHVVRIAGEGRKYGLYLLLSTQRPAKVHENVLSQCDNLLMMRMNSAADIQTLTETFSYAPPGLVAQAAGFGLGEGLAAGKIAPAPLLFKSGQRFTVEGGTDVPSSWAQTR